MTGKRDEAKDLLAYYLCDVARLGLDPDEVRHLVDLLIDAAKEEVREKEGS